MNFNQKKDSFVLWFHRVFFMHQCPKFFSDALQAILNQKGEKKMTWKFRLPFIKISEA